MFEEIEALKAENAELKATIARMEAEQGRSVKTFRGKRWEVWVGDCLRILPMLERNSISQIITDPPYCAGGPYRADRLQAPSKKYQQTGSINLLPEFWGDNKDGFVFERWMVRWMEETIPLLKGGASLFCFMSAMQIPPVMIAIESAGFVLRQQMAVWAKPIGRARPTRGTFWGGNEFILHATKGAIGAMFSEDDQKCLPGIFTDDVVPLSERKHASQKPVSLIKQLIMLPPGGVVLDPFGGTGTTGEAYLSYAHETGHDGKVIIIEYMDNWGEMCAERLEALESGRDWKASPSQLSLLGGK